ncbi:hypothetical protein S7711_01988 [Stachybotrys chartarum IBT 7711]|uniref:Uncharacterized protein n=1 Tax=Stachybotrys chartarum (strain CBS 109288 / IBT 7711) TaxID=1280523 RepID=A0A084AVW7_STACB|nr:hypothetical protein S7711_01988 [Stachybotrys chartarum IBT 7711]KFA47361.1 hypothetical protein S40293_07585 [Stachybotrys chartarum IBT 40293]
MIGCHVIATARNFDVLKDLGARGLSILELDVTSQESVIQAKARVEELTGGRLDILINNAGRTHTIPASDVDIDDARQTYDVNLFGPMRMCKEYLSLLIAARGLIINVSSGTSVVPYLFGSVYSSTKSALNQYSRTLRMELQPFNVRVMVLMTGTVRSNIANHAERALPGGSLWKPVEDYFDARKAWSQRNGTMPADRFAEKVVTMALRGEGWLTGTRDWFWVGGMAFAAWIASVLPAWVSELVVARLIFNMGPITRRLQAARTKKD